MTSGPMWAKKPAAERAPTGRPVNLLVRESVEYRLAGTLNNMTTTTETVLSTPIVRKPAEENGEKPQQRSADWENPRVASILSAAAKCFARKGFTATTLAEIGKELGLRKSIVHYYFASKAALIHEVQSYTYHRYLDRLREAIKNGDGSVAQTTKQADSSACCRMLTSVCSEKRSPKIEPGYIAE